MKPLDAIIKEIGCTGEYTWLYGNPSKTFCFCSCKDWIWTLFSFYIRHTMVTLDWLAIEQEFVWGCVNITMLSPFLRFYHYPVFTQSDSSTSVTSRVVESTYCIPLLAAWGYSSVCIRLLNVNTHYFVLIFTINVPMVSLKSVVYCYLEGLF